MVRLQTFQSGCLPFDSAISMLPATLTCCSLGMSSQSKQQRVSPVRNRLPFSASMSFTFVKMVVIAFLLVSSLLRSMCLNLEYTFSIFLFTSLSEMKRLWPPGMFFMMCLSIFSFSSTATPLSIRMGGWAASKFDLKSAGGLFMSTVRHSERGLVRIVLVEVVASHLNSKLGCGHAVTAVSSSDDLVGSNDGSSAHQAATDSAGQHDLVGELSRVGISASDNPAASPGQGS